ncbi:MAG: ParB/RepB/Spo0J family partition protein, partial [Candidatus Moranbacteria bacterium]|nr:ParB/RepB/Spo0J family partition protein [Candidatus Moranbacteria bacterium]
MSLKKWEFDMSGLGLNEIGDLSSLLVEDNNRWREIEIDLLKEDPNQPRKSDNPGFSADSLAELSATIKLRGVKSPISVRDDLDQPGHYIINHGARRYRASILAGKTMIPAFVDND